MSGYIAQKYVVSTPGQEIIGQLAMSNLQGIMSAEFQPYLKEHGLVNVRADQWICHQNVLDLYQDIEDGKTRVMFGLVAIGKKSAESLVLPPEVQTLDAALEGLDIVYQLNIRPVAAGEGYFLTRIGTGHYKMIVNVPYPHDLLYGFLWGFTNRFCPRNASFTVHTLANLAMNTEPGFLFDIQWKAENGPRRA